MRKLITPLILLTTLITFGQSPNNQVKTCFAWGAEVGSSIDVSEHDMSALDFGAYFGFSRGWIKFAGVGASANIMVNNSCRSYPVYASFRTDFSNSRRLLFADVRGGISLNYLPDNVSQTCPYVSSGVGINLAGNNNFNSYIWLGYTYIGRNNVDTPDYLIYYEDLHFVTVRLGIVF